MIIEISVAVIAGAFAILSVFLIVAVVKAQKTLKEVNRVLHTTKKEMEEMSVEGIKLMKNLNETTVDVKKKLHALDILFHPLASMKDEMENAKQSKHKDLATEIAECLAAGFTLYSKIKGGIAAYVKSR
jgi:uncharacterized protein YoxC